MVIRPGVSAIILTAEGLLLQRRADNGLWGLPGGGVEPGESVTEALVREVREETGLDATRHELRDWGVENRFEIFKKHLGRYAPGVTHNLERVFSMEVPAPLEVALDPAEHRGYKWLPWREAAALTISSTNRDAILALPRRLGASAA